MDCFLDNMGRPFNRSSCSIGTKSSSRNQQSDRRLLQLRGPSPPNRRQPFATVLLLLLLVLPTVVVVHAQRIAIIGGGIGGSFTAKYLVDYDNDCAIESIVIFEAMPLPTVPPVKTGGGGGGGTITVHDKPNAEWQGSRVTSLQLENNNGGAVLELGASIGHSGFHYVLEMIANDAENLQRIPPLGTGSRKVDHDENAPHTTFGIYNGETLTLVHGNVAKRPSSLIFNKMLMMTRYNWDLIQVHRACTLAMKKFAKFPKLLASTDPDTFFESPDALWDRVGLQNLVHSSFATFLDALGVKQGGGYLSSSTWFPFLGSLRDELLTAINLVNYNQDTTQVNALVGLGSFAASVGGLFSIQGGNYKIVQSAQRQANANRNAKCTSSSSSTTVPFVQQVEKRITTVVGSSLGEGFTLYAAGAAAANGQEQEEQQVVGQFDIVVLAVPLQMARIEFLVKSHVDESVLVLMPLGGALVDAHGHDDDDDDDNSDETKKKHQVQVQHEGHEVLPKQVLPDAAKRPYTQVVTTIISNATLSSQLFGIAEEDAVALLPASILVTSAGKADLHNMSVIRRMGEPGLYRTFSDDPLPDSVLTKFFGPHYKLEYVKVWGGPHGGATPDYQGQGASTPFLLYDAAATAGQQGGQHAKKGGSGTGALYYPSAMELSTLASMEMSAVGARAVAKLCAQRLGLLKTKSDDEIKDEL